MTSGPTVAGGSLTINAGAKQGKHTSPRMAEVSAMRRFARPDPSADRFLEVAERRLRRLEAASAAARDSLDTEIERLASNARGPGEAAGLSALGEELIEHAVAVTANTKRLREKVRSLRPPDHRREQEDDAALARRDQALQAGMTSVARRMALTGHSETEIAKAFSGLGVDDSDAAVRAALDRTEA